MGKVSLPDFMTRALEFYSAESEHRRFSARLRLKASADGTAEQIRAEAIRRLEFQMGKYPSEEPDVGLDDPEEASAIESSMRQMEADIIESIAETESYAWGLAVAGIYHLWEQTSRKLVSRRLSRDEKQLRNIDLKMICKLITRNRLCNPAVTKLCPSWRVPPNRERHQARLWSFIRLFA